VTRAVMSAVGGWLIGRSWINELIDLILKLIKG
jgi:hypothetical protein